MKKISADLIIIGAGLAGLRAALAAQQNVKKIIIINKGKLFASGSTFLNRNGQWGMTYAENDHECDILFNTIENLSQGTNIPELSKILVEESFPAFVELSQWGVKFRSDAKQKINRLSPCFCDKPLASIIQDTGQAAAIIKQRLNHSQITCLEQTQALELLIDHESCHGVLAKDLRHEYLINAPATILASGGDAATYTPNIVEPGLTGDGYILLEKAGLELANMSYQQRVWEDINPAAPRFPVTALTDGNYSFQSATGSPLSFSHLPPDILYSRKNHVPISNLQSDRAVDQILLEHLTPDPSSAIQVCSKESKKITNRIYPHHQVSNGGIIISKNAETKLKGLFAAGEVTTGMHGGDRVGGMMITNCLVFGKRAGEAAVRYIVVPEKCYF